MTRAPDPGTRPARREDAGGSIYDDRGRVTATWRAWALSTTTLLRTWEAEVLVQPCGDVAAYLETFPVTQGARAGHVDLAARVLAHTAGLPVTGEERIA